MGGVIGAGGAAVQRIALWLGRDQAGGTMKLIDASREDRRVAMHEHRVFFVAGKAMRRREPV
jgi:hypothetical protein